jgi:DNA-binding transcriptional LysR family regulator
MNILQLESFVTLAEELHFGRAASRLMISSPNLSKRIAELERELGLSLFTRTSRRVNLTPAGQLLLDQTIRTLREANQLKVMASHAASGHAGVLRAFYSPGNGELLTSLIRRVRKDSPYIEIVLEQHISTEVIEAVRSSRATIGITRGIAGGLAALALTHSARNVLLIAVDHPLTKKGTIELDDLEGEVFLQTDLSINPMASPQSWHTTGTKFLVRHERVFSETEYMDRIAAGFGIGLVSKAFSIRNQRPDVTPRLVNLSGDAPVEENFLVWRKEDESGLIRSLVSIATGMVRQD